jgi:hypothetical protein
MGSGRKGRPRTKTHAVEHPLVNVRPVTAQAGMGVGGHDEKGRFTRSDNVTTARGTSALYTLKRLKREQPDLFQH